MLQKQPVPINFAQGLDTKTDPKQVQLGKFLVLQNSVFTKGGLLQKRNGYGLLSALPNTATTYLTTFNGNLSAIGTTLSAYSKGTASWVNKGSIQPLSLSTLPVARSALNQTQCDTALAPNGLMCVVFTEVNNGTSTYKYSVLDSTTGQRVVNPTAIPVNTGAVSGSPRVFLLGGYFIVVFTNLISATSHLQYIAISTNSPTSVRANADIAVSYAPSTNLSWDAVVTGNKLFIGYNTTSGGQQIEITTLSTNFTVAAPIAFVGSIATSMSLCADMTTLSNPAIYASFWDSAGSTGYAVGVDQNLNIIMTPTQFLSTGTIKNLASTARNGVLTIVYEVSNAYSYDSGIPTNYLQYKTVTLPGSVTTGTVSSATTILRSLGLASKAFLYNSTMYMLGTYSAPLQPTYFLIDLSGNIVSRFAYENGGGYVQTGLPSAQVTGDVVSIAYLYKDLIQSTNTTGLTESIGPAGASNIYSQTGVNVASITFDSSTLSVSEIGANLNISGGMLWAYDGRTVNEQGFHLFPSSVECVWSATGGSIHAQPDGATNINAYYYQVTYEWTDAQGNIIRSAPSIPVGVTTTSTGTAGSITVNVPTLRLTYKTNVKIVIYRWSVANQTYYQVTSITAPTLNDKTVDSIAYVDTLADSSIIGNSIIYTTGGVVEDIAGPAATATTLFDDRLWLIDAEDQNLLWFSKQVIENTPVEMSDLLTMYVAPTTSSQGSTGPMRCLAPMDDKIIIFKKNAIYYVNGTGPDNTGSNNQYSQPVFITGTVGCVNQNSIVLTPQGLMFQSDKGIWLLRRDLGYEYIGAPVEAFNASTVNSAVSIPGTNQVRFTLSTGETLMYDYYYQQWGTFIGVPAISSTLYESLHTYVNSAGQVLQETPGLYLDNRSNPVLLGFTTSWINLAGLQGYQRAYYFYLLGQYMTPHKIQIGIAYDYNSSPEQSILITPDNYTPNYGTTAIGPYGAQDTYGGDDLEQWRVFLAKQKCMAFQISFTEVFDPSKGVVAGSGLTLSGLNLVVGLKKGYKPIPSSKSTG